MGPQAYFWLSIGSHCASPVAEQCLKDQVGGLFHAICNFLKDGE